MGGKGFVVLLGSMFISMLVGGRRVYTGKDISAAHARARAQGLTGEHLDAFLKHFRAALVEVGVGPDKAEKVKITNYCCTHFLINFFKILHN